MRAEFLSPALEDSTASVEFYESERPGLGAAFLDEVERSSCESSRPWELRLPQAPGASISSGSHTRSSTSSLRTRSVSSPSSIISVGQATGRATSELCRACENYRRSHSRRPSTGSRLLVRMVSRPSRQCCRRSVSQRLIHALAIEELRFECSCTFLRDAIRTCRPCRVGFAIRWGTRTEGPSRLAALRLLGPQ